MKTSNKLILAPIAIILLGATLLIAWRRLNSVPAPAIEQTPVEAPAAPQAPEAPAVPQ